MPLKQKFISFNAQAHLFWWENKNW